MTPAAQVAFAWKRRDHFEAVRRHNLQVVCQRRRGDWSGRYRNAWAELGAYERPTTSEGRRGNPNNTWAFA